MNRYFAVETKCGRVGKNKCIYIWFALAAETADQAAAKARNLPRVKRHHKDAIANVTEITQYDYEYLLFVNDCDPYLKCKNIQQQRRTCNMNGRIVADEYLLKKCEQPIKNRDTEYRIKKHRISLKSAKAKLQEYFDYSDIA